MGRTDGGGTERIVGEREGKGAKKKSRNIPQKRLGKGEERERGDQGEKREWCPPLHLCMKRWAGKAGGGGDRKV